MKVDAQLLVDDSQRSELRESEGITAIGSMHWILSKTARKKRPNFLPCNLYTVVTANQHDNHDYHNRLTIIAACLSSCSP